MHPPLAHIIGASTQHAAIRHPPATGPLPLALELFEVLGSRFRGSGVQRFGVPNLRMLAYEKG